MPPFVSIEHPQLLMPNGIRTKGPSIVKVLERDEIEVVSLKGRDEDSSLYTESDNSVETRKVTFQSHSRVRMIPNRKAFTPDEIARAWMARVDYERTRTEATDTFHLLDRGVFIPDDDTKICAMGVDSTQRHRRRRKAYRTSVRTVLEEQKSQQHEGYRCEDLIAMAYMEHSEEAQNRAYLAGVMMALQAKD